MLCRAQCPVADSKEPYPCCLLKAVLGLVVFASSCGAGYMNAGLLQLWGYPQVFCIIPVPVSAEVWGLPLAWLSLRTHVALFTAICLAIHYYISATAS
jgi:hypothetical protein